MNETSKDPDIYYTIEEQQDYELIVKKSRFIGQAFPVDSPEKAMGVLEVIRSAHYNANHNCFAYSIGQTGMEYRYSDDGEPAGTAGMPILFMINKMLLHNILVVVTRYFGGTKLGIGGLAHAYNETAKGVIEKCTRKPIYITQKVKVFSNYADISPIKKLIDKYAVSFEEQYRDSVEFIVEIKSSQTNDFKEKLINLTSGRAGYSDFNN